MVSKQRADQIGGGVFLIGLGLLFTDVLSFWPGILLVIGASALASGIAEGQSGQKVTGGLWMLGIGLFFLVGFSWPLILILIGVGMLFSRGQIAWCGNGDKEKRKRKNEEILQGEMV
jgi:hypothetical protein